MGRTRIFTGVLVFLVLVAGCTRNSHSAGSNLCHATGQPPSAPGDAAGVLIVPAAAVHHSMTIDVDARHDSPPRCVISGSQLSPSSPIRLHVGDQTTYIANDPPALSPAARKIVSISTTAIPRRKGPLSHPHVHVFVTAKASGSVTLQFVGCDGTGC
jgi:hypothetical protein